MPSPFRSRCSLRWACSRWRGEGTPPGHRRRTILAGGEAGRRRAGVLRDPRRRSRPVQRGRAGPGSDRLPATPARMRVHRGVSSPILMRLRCCLPRPGLCAAPFALHKAPVSMRYLGYLSPRIKRVDTARYARPSRASGLRLDLRCAGPLQLPPTLALRLDCESRDGVILRW